ncbi:hypothetical protein ACS0TY_036885 [Phlomoides rotata]
MGSEFENHSIHHHHFLRQKPNFLPMLCRLSIKDTKLNHRRRSDPRFSDEPSSPKVSCMGSVKRNNRVTGLPPPGPAAAHHHNNYSKLRRLFSGKALLPPAAATTAARGRRSKSCGSSHELRGLDLKKECEIVDVGELDPPLPVVKRAAPPVRGEVNLWRRRFDGAALEKLQIQPIDSRNCNLKPPNATV